MELNSKPKIGHLPYAIRPKHILVKNLLKALKRMPKHQKLCGRRHFRKY